MPNWRRLPWQLGYVKGPWMLSRARRLWIRATHTHANVVIPPTSFLGPGFSVMIPNAGELIVGDYVSFRRGFYIEISGTGRVRIGDRTIFTSVGAIQCTTSVDIGSDCNFGQALMIVDGNHRFRDPEVPLNAQGYEYKPVTIGDRATITTKVTIVGANIGEGSFIAANAVVTKDIPAYSLAAGVPARVVEELPRPQLASNA